jgi:hypothetical protein
MSPPGDLDGLSHAELKGLVVRQWEEMVELQRMVAALRDEIARLKGGPGRPNIKPSGMEQATEPKPPGSSGNQRRGRGSTRSKLSVHEERTVKVAAPPRGSRFKGYTSFVVQDLVIRPHVVDFRCERWQTPDGNTMTAPLPAGIHGHFGPQLHRFVLAQYHQGQVTVPRLVTLLQALGIVISKRQVVRLLIEGQDGFLGEARDVLRAGLSSAAWITVDDTGARHKAANGFCTQIGNAHFTWFGTTASKSRLNFLALLRAGHDDYVVNAEALAYMRERALAAHVIARLVEHPDSFEAADFMPTSRVTRDTRLCKPGSVAYRTGLRHVETEIRKRRAETGAEKPPIHDRKAGNCRSETRAGRQEGARRLISRSLLCSTSSTPCECAKASSGLSESCP